CGGNFGPAIKQCGYDGIFFTGVSERPVYLYVDDKGPELRPADHMWGLDAIQTEETLLRENSRRKKPAAAVIGPATEKLSLIAGIVNDGGRIAARSGCGAVMRSKRLKGVLLAGSKPVGCQDAQAMKAISKQLAAKLRKIEMPRFFPGILLALMGRVMGKLKKSAPLDGIILPMLLKRWGTPMNNLLGATSGDTPMKNWGGSVADYRSFEYHGLNPDQVLRLEQKKYHCSSCNIGCGGVCDLAKITEGAFEQGHKPEYETCAAFGGLLLNRDLKSILYINELLNRAGMDTISAGGTVAFAIECYENGVITKEMTGGLELAWGDPSSITELVRRMISRQGIGDLLADGSKAAATRLGKAALPYLVHAGGQEPGMHDSRMDPVVGVHYSVDPTPGRHTVGSGQYYDMMHLWDRVSWAPNPGIYDKAGEYLDTDQIALKTAANACYKQLTDGAGGCLFAMVMGVHHWKLFEWINAAAGWQKTADEL
ncbi:MAG: aldehyde ferredoxin oxidoreductase C-terminal domain-containing protein, partial [Anaerolineaceae bacterium]